MKKHLFSALLLSLVITAVPALPVCFGGQAASAPGSGSRPAPEAIIHDAEISSAEPYKVLDTATGKVLLVPVREYVIGAVCAEMPASFEPEALKAQAVAAHTYAERQRRLSRQAPDAELAGADFSNDTSRYQGYLTNAEIRQAFGENYAECYKKISAAADEVLPYVMTYGGEPIIAAFHSMSSGTTESAENAWGAPVDYLVPVDSSSDKNAPSYEEELRMDGDELRRRLEAAFGDVGLGEDMTKWVTVAERSGSGTVLTARAGDRTVTGSDIRAALGLRSADFSIAYDGSKAVFTTHGCGHGVGMSQYGANSMAAAGSTWREILAHYYPDCNIEKTAD
jgi:stage II sporulation protein D